MEKHLHTPIGDRDIKELSYGDVVYISGEIVTARDKAHAKLVKEEPPEGLNLNVIYHAGPLVKKIDKETKVLSCGPTTSSRMQEYIGHIEKKYKTKVFIGKGKLKTEKSVFLLFTGGCGVLAASKIVRVKKVYWKKLGLPEALWVLEVQKFGPLVVVNPCKKD